MELPTDLKNYRDRSGWNLFTPEEAGTFLALLVLGFIACELFFRLVLWMTA